MNEQDIRRLVTQLLLFTTEGFRAEYQLKELGESAHDEFSELDDSFYKDADEIEKQLCLYVAANAGSFPALPGRAGQRS